MEAVNFKGHKIMPMIIKDNFQRRALMFKNKIVSALVKTGITEDDIELEFNGQEVKKAKASVTWYFDGHMLHYGNNSMDKYVENLYVVSKVIEGEVERVLSGEKTILDFVEEFREEDDLEKHRKEAREFFGIPHDSKDMELINQKYKEMARTLHPDMPTGDTEKFKQLNHHHKILKRELM
jgi:hypothetical protein